MIEEVTIGKCRLILGDCREVLPLLPDFDLILTDPPYGAAYAKEYEVMLVTPDVSLANKRKRELDVNPSLGTHNFKYSILRMKLTLGTNADCDFEK